MNLLPWSQNPEAYRLRKEIILAKRKPTEKYEIEEGIDCDVRRMIN